MQDTGSSVETRGSEDYYALLGIEADADDVEVRRAWRRLALRWHPDRAGPGASARFRRIAAAYAVLSNPATRAAYDRMRNRPTGSTTGKGTATTRRRAPGVMLSRLSGSLNALLACGIARRAKDGSIDLFFDAEEAAQGGMVTISMRVLVRCPACAAEPEGACRRCGDKRTLDELFSAWLAVPPGVAEGTVLVPSAQLPGVVGPVNFRVRLRGVG